MNASPYKKLNLVTSLLAREFYNLPAPSRIPTISAYTEQFGVSRGVVQDALGILQKNGCVTLRARGMKGTYLAEKDMARLYDATQWNVITGTMPTPLVTEMQGMATAVCSAIGESDVPFSFAFVTGAARRAEALRNQLYDFSIMSAFSAAYIIEKHPELQVAVNLHPCLYATGPYVLLVRGKNARGIEDGMRIVCDPFCPDQTRLTQRLSAGKKVRLVDEPYMGVQEMFISGATDALVFRYDKWMNELPDVAIIPIDGQPDSNVPVVVVNRENYRIEQLLSHLFVPSAMAKVQQGVLRDPSKVRFY